MGSNMDEAVDALLAIGSGAELIRLNGHHGESRRDEIAEARILSAGLSRVARPGSMIDRWSGGRPGERGPVPRVCSLACV